MLVFSALASPPTGGLARWRSLEDTAQVSGLEDLVNEVEEIVVRLFVKPAREGINAEVQSLLAVVESIRVVDQKGLAFKELEATLDVGTFKP
ncbi:MAG TPA: hypothetical protein VLE27_02645 [Thermoanaerobaculia bacterium]|nr:hypothetical protein [Thermoanaerobaculia bacterium]